MKEWPKIFENAQVGDEVYCRMRGDGVIIAVNRGNALPIECAFNDGIDSNEYYLFDGRIYNNSPEPLLFYRKDDERYLTERPEPEKEIDWKEWEGKEIEVFNSGSITKEKRILYKYKPSLCRPFICYDSEKTNVLFTWEKAVLIEEQKEPEIDWSRVPEDTKVRVSDLKDRIDKQDIELFMGYFPKLEYPFWVFSDSDKESAHGYSFCKLAEPCKPEWDKK